MTTPEVDQPRDRFETVLLLVVWVLPVLVATGPLWAVDLGWFAAARLGVLVVLLGVTLLLSDRG